MVLKRMLVATDGSRTAEKAANYGIRLAVQLKCQVLAVCVVEDYKKLSMNEMAEISTQTREELTEMMMQEAKEAVARIAKEASSHGIEVTTEVLEGRDAAAEIVGIAEGKRVDFIVIGSHGRTNIVTYPLGSVASKILASDSEIPVFVVKAKGQAVEPV